MRFWYFSSEARARKNARRDGEAFVWAVMVFVAPIVFLSIKEESLTLGILEILGGINGQS